MRQITALLALAVLLMGSVALAHPTPYPIPVRPPTPQPPPPGATPAYVCVWIQLKGPGPHPFTPAPGQDIRDVEVDIPGDELLPPMLDGFLPEPVLGAMGLFNDFELIGQIVEPEFGPHVNVGHWFNGVQPLGTLIEIENPKAGPEDTWYVHFTPEPATLALLALGGLALLRRRLR
jgi:hypothetical protein